MHFRSVLAALLEFPQQTALAPQEGAVGLRGALHLRTPRARPHVDPADHRASIYPAVGTKRSAD